MTPQHDWDVSFTYGLQGKDEQAYWNAEAGTFTDEAFDLMGSEAADFFTKPERRGICKVHLDGCATATCEAEAVSIAWETIAEDILASEGIALDEPGEAVVTLFHIDVTRLD